MHLSHYIENLYFFDRRKNQGFFYLLILANTVSFLKRYDDVRQAAACVKVKITEF